MAKKAKGAHKPPNKTSKHAEMFEKAMEAALNDAHSWGPGPYPKVRVTFEASVEVTNPGHVGEYRVFLDELP
jgi:hypothetical protein